MMTVEINVIDNNEEVELAEVNQIESFEEIVETISDNEVKIAEIEADKEITIAAIEAEVDVASIEAQNVQNNYLEERIDELCQKLETLTQIILSLTPPPPNFSPVEIASDQTTLSNLTPISTAELTNETQMEAIDESADVKPVFLNPIRRMMV